jgi:hypothetical protein
VNDENAVAHFGLDATNAEEAFAAGNAVCPAIAKWIAEILNRS